MATDRAELQKMGRPENAENGVKSFDFLNRSELPLVTPLPTVAQLRKSKDLAPSSRPHPHDGAVRQLQSPDTYWIYPWVNS